MKQKGIWLLGTVLALMSTIIVYMLIRLFLFGDFQDATKLCSVETVSQSYGINVSQYVTSCNEAYFEKAISRSGATSYILRNNHDRNTPESFVLEIPKNHSFIYVNAPKASSVTLEYTYPWGNFIVTLKFVESQETVTVYFELKNDAQTIRGVFTKTRDYDAFIDNEQIDAVMETINSMILIQAH